MRKTTLLSISGPTHGLSCWLVVAANTTILTCCGCELLSMMACLAPVWLSIVTNQTMVSISPDLNLPAGFWALCLGPSSLLRLGPSSLELAFTLSLLNSWGSATSPSSSVREVTARVPLGPVGGTVGTYSQNSLSRQPGDCIQPCGLSFS